MIVIDKYPLNFFAVTVLIATALSACKKDKLQPLPIETISENCLDCIPLSEGNFGQFDQYIYDSIYYTSAQFNPNDDNEIVFLQWLIGEQKLYKYNILTGQKTLLFTGNFSGSTVSWGSEDWILFQLMDFQIWKIKSDGTQLTQVTSNGAWFHPEWNSSGTEFIAYQGYIDGDYLFPGKILNNVGSIVDSFYWKPLIGDWNNSFGYYGCVNTHKISVLNPYSGEFISQCETDMTSFSTFNWISDNEALVSSVDGIFKYHIYSGVFNKIKCSCNSKKYSGGSVSSDHSLILYSLATRSRINGSTILEKSEIVSLNLNSLEEEVITIPH